MAQTMLTEKSIKVIPADPRLATNGKTKGRKLRVAAYCRVSTDDDDQLNSYEAQVDYYTQKIQNTDEWEMAGIFPDEGITGTNLKKREKFKEMMRLCRRGKIDMILCKSVSRFARNTVDCLNAVRELKELSIPVIFEKENIDTSQHQSEFIITLYGSFAQAESESISNNVTWGKRKSMRDGKVIFRYDKLMGYEKGTDGKPQIVPEEAAIVLRIYRSYLAGKSLVMIQQELQDDGIPTKRGIEKWSRSVLQSILTNEKYIGDALLQKTYITDCLTKKSKKNNGELPQYYVEGNHPAIVTKELFNRVQEEMARRANKRKTSQKLTKTQRGKFSAKYALTERLVCGECGTPYRRCTWSRNGVKRIVWRCINRLEFGTKYCKESPTLDEHRIHAAIVTAINRILAEKDEITALVKHSAISALNEMPNETDEFSIRQRLSDLDKHLNALIEGICAGGDTDSYDAEIKWNTEEKLTLSATLKEIETRSTILQNADTGLQEIFDAIEAYSSALEEYDDALAALIIERVTVKDEQTLSMKFNMGVELEVQLPE